MASGDDMEKKTEDLSGRLVRYIALAAFGSIALVIVLDLIVAKLHVVPQEFLWTMFDLGSERNVPTWLASVLWLFTGIAALACLWVDERGRPRTLSGMVWLIMAVAFIYASIDEVATIHEEVGTFLTEEFARHASVALPEGSPHSPWILFYLPIVVIFLALALVFLWRKLKGSRWSRLCLLLAVECYLVAIGLDYFQGLYPQYHRAVARTLGMKARPFVEVTIVTEEALELTATATLLVVLCSFARRRIGGSNQG